MCAICGLVLKTARIPMEEGVKLCGKMAGAMVHRGPDDQGSYWDDKHRAVLGHRRLSIIDPTSAGRQPFYNEDRSIAVLINGEIYNYRELQAELKDRGHRFLSNCDGEVVAHLFEEGGPSLWTRLRGMYAAAIYEVGSGLLHLARDPLGIKPLYWMETPDLVAFSSEIRAFDSLEATRSRLDWDGVADFLLLGSIPSPRTHRMGVRALAPGEVVQIDSSGIRKRWGSSPVPGWCCEASEAGPPSISKLRECLRDSVSKHLISDVPIGLFLSGGIDSGVLAGLAAECSSHQLHTISVTVPNHVLDESSYAHETAAAFGTHHTEVPLDQKSFEEDLSLFFKHLDMPSIDGLNTFVVSKAARKAGLTVALTGVGGDELFAGYSTFHWIPRLTRVHRMAGYGGNVGRHLAAFILERSRPGSSSARCAEILRSKAADFRGGYLAARGLFVGKLLEELLVPEAKIHARQAQARFMDETAWVLDPRIGPLLGVGGLEVTRYMSAQLLRDTDVMSMAHSLEVRTPLVDAEVVRCALPFLTHFQKGDGYPKWALRQALVHPLPERVVRRSKQGFVFPWQEWLRGMVLQDFDRRLTESRYWSHLMRPEAVRHWRDAYVQGWAHWSCFWAIYVLMRFCESERP